MADESLRKSYFAVLTAPVLKDPSLSWASMVLCAKIAQLTEEEGFCYATNAGLIQMMTRVDPKSGAVSTPSERTLQNWLSELRDGGHIFTDTGPLPPDKNGVIRTGRRIFIGTGNQTRERGAENFTPANFCTGGVHDSAPPFKCINNKNKKDTPIAPKEIFEEVITYCGENQRLLEAFAAFLTMRAVNLKNPVDTAYKLHLITGKLDRESKGSGNIKVLMLDNATNGKWSKVWPLKPHEIPEQDRVREQEGVTSI